MKTETVVPFVSIDVVYHAVTNLLAFKTDCMHYQTHFSHFIHLLIQILPFFLKIEGFVPDPQFKLLPYVDPAAADRRLRRHFASRQK